MGRNRSKYQNESASKVSIKLYEKFGLNKNELFSFWNDYKELSAPSKDLHFTMLNLQNLYDIRYIYYFAALAMEIISKEIIEGIQIDKKES